MSEATAAGSTVMEYQPPLWRTEIVVPAGAVPVFESAMAEHAIAVSSFDADPAARGTGQLWHIQALNTAPPDHAALTARLAAAAIAARIAVPEPHVTPFSPHDALQASEGVQDPIRIGRFTIWNTPGREAATTRRYDLSIDCGLAFGTGRHESTQGCLLALNDLAKARRFERVLDLGTGSGILAFAAARLWCGRVWAIDHDPVAVRIACGNAARNRLRHRVRIARGSGVQAPSVAADAPYDLITANILAAPLVSLAPDLVSVLAPTGVIVLSGLLESEEAGVRAAYRAHGLALVRRIVRAGWSTLILGRCGKGLSVPGPALDT